VIKPKSLTVCSGSAKIRTDFLFSMKKLVLVLGCVMLLSAAGVSAQGTPPGISSDFSVVNVSKDNADATLVGARPGDVLRYELTFSGSGSFLNFAPEVMLTDVLEGTEVVNLGGGTLDGTTLTFEGFSDFGTCAESCTKTFSFFVRVKPNCADKKSLTADYSADSLRVSLDCKLAQTGPNGIVFAVLGLVLLLGYVFLSERREV